MLPVLCWWEITFRETGTTSEPFIGTGKIGHPVSKTCDLQYLLIV